MLNWNLPETAQICETFSQFSFTTWSPDSNDDDEYNRLGYKLNRNAKKKKTVHHFSFQLYLGSYTLWSGSLSYHHVKILCNYISENATILYYFIHQHEVSCFIQSSVWMIWEFIKYTYIWYLSNCSTSYLIKLLLVLPSLISV